MRVDDDVDVVGVHARVLQGLQAHAQAFGIVEGEERVHQQKRLRGADHGARRADVERPVVGDEVRSEPRRLLQRGDGGLVGREDELEAGIVDPRHLDRADGPAGHDATLRPPFGA